MSRKNIFLIFSLICIFILIVIICFWLFYPRYQIKMAGDSHLKIEVGSTYTDLGATAYIGNILHKKTVDIESKSNLNTSKLGDYTITYQIKNSNKKVERTIEVIDTTAPNIELKSEITACKNNNKINIDAVVTDNYDGDLTDNLKYKVDKEKIYITISDSSKNETKLEGNLKYIDDEKPVITLKGSAKINVLLNEKYEEYGATAQDSCDGDISQNIQISSNVDTSKEGTYEVNYEIKDSIGETSSIKRTVVVGASQDNYSTVSDGTIYLTFDDGPGKYTAKILDILDKYNVKATFFVTSQFSGYLDKIKDEYDRGHTVGIHTYSHKWSIYDSVETYLDDFNKIEQIVYDKTGVHPKYFRFPGGSSNTVSRSHSVGIMSKLSSLMTEKGYTYFDWHVDSCDTCKNNSVSDIISTIKKYVRGSQSYIILMHDIKENTMKALPSVIEYLQGKGYKFSAINENTPLKQFKIAN